MTAKHPGGRPSDYNQDTAVAICERLADGESLRAICRDADMPSMPTVFRWLGAHDEFRNQYTCAREAQADAIFDEVLDIADNADDDSVQVARLRIDTRKWAAGKLRPKVYGDKLQTENNHTFSPEVASWLGLTS